MICVDVAINLPVKNIFRQFTYTLPENLLKLDVGWRCVVPFGNQLTEGFVVRRYDADVVSLSCKNVTAAIGHTSWFDKSMLATARWLADYYMCSLAEAMRLFVPGKTSIRRHAVYDDNGNLVCYEYEERLKDKTVLAYSITVQGEEFLAKGSNRAKVQMKALKILYDANVAMTQEEMGKMGVSGAILRALAEKKLVQAGSKRILRDSYKLCQNQDIPLVLTDEQSRAVEEINGALIQNVYAGFLLRGITGSGKTEVYLCATHKALAQGKQVLVLVPEIALTAQLVERFKSRFGNQIAVAHSKLSANERGDVWYRTSSGLAKILIGVRSAVFAPFEKLGLVIIDEEQEASYKQEERPNYHARDVAKERCKESGAVLLLGSATPSLESYYCAQKGIYRELVLNKRPMGQMLPEVDIVDMRRELAEKNYSVLSRLLQKKLSDIVLSDDQAIILLNRRGYSTFVLCRDCGYTVKCDHCDVAMVYHQTDNLMRCHYCGKTERIPAECPECHSRRIKFFGTGTQRAEEELESIQGLSVLRMDQDSTRKKSAHQEILCDFRSQKYNVLIGTQMVAKGHDIPNVTLVGVLSSDSSMHLPDFRSAERTFDLLTQAAGRSGRGIRPGRVVFQTYDPDNKVIQLAANQDYASFACEELHIRREYNYPPYCCMLKIILLDKDEKNALDLATRLREDLYKNCDGDGLEIMGPFPALVAKVRDLYRFNLIIKGKNLDNVKQWLLGSKYRDLRNVYFDVDPMNVV